MTQFRCKNLLVTGGAGFIGSNFIHYILTKYEKIKIYNLDLLTYAGNLNNTSRFAENKRYKFIQGDICDEIFLDKIFKSYKIDGVINFAAESHVDNSIKNPKIFIETNVMGTFSLLKTSYKNWMSSNFNYFSDFRNARFHQISTDEVYGSSETESFKEDNICQPNSPYSASKASADMIVRSFTNTYGLNTSISRCSNNFGPNQHKEKFIPKIIKSVKGNIPVKVYGDGKNIRDWLHVLDHCKAIDVIFNRGQSGSIYNIGGDNELTNLELIDLIFSLFDNNYKLSINFVTDRYGHDKRYSIDSSKIKQELKWKPVFDFKKSLKEIINSY